MSLVDSNPIWFGLGDFYTRMFPEEERVYWETFWEAYSDIIADLWGYTFQVDRAKSLYSTTPTMERREVLIQFSDLVQGIDAQFQISSLRQDSSGRYILRGFVPREQRTFKEADLPDQGLIRIGVDLISYIQANVTTVVGGIYDGFVREVSFVLDEVPAHDYGDDPDLNEDFRNDQARLKFRINQLAGQVFVDAVLIDTQQVEVNPTGVLVLGTAGINSEIVEYESVAVIGDRYVFTLATSWQAPDTFSELLSFNHFADEPLSVERYDRDRWTQQKTGRSRISSQGDLRMVVDQSPAPAAAKVELLGQYKLEANIDFDVSVVINLDTWDDPGPVVTSKRAYARLKVGAQSYVLGVETRRDGGGSIEHVVTYGPLGAEAEIVLDAVVTPYRFEARFKRVGGMLEFQFRPVDDDAFQLLTTLSSTGARASLDLVTEDPDSESPSQVRFDEVVRRVGDVVGNTRLEDFFSATEVFPYVYTIDQDITFAEEIRDRPRTRSEFLSTVDEIDSVSPGTIRAVAEGADFSSQGVPTAGVIQIDGTEIIYDSFTRDGDIFSFAIRGEIDPNIIPVSVNTVFTAGTSVLRQAVDYEFSGDGKISLKKLPTRDRMWAPVANVDIKHVQNSYGQLVDLTASISNEAYLNRVQGTWFALMSGPSIQNVESGLQLAMGLPVAKIDGTVTSIFEESDDLGRVIRRALIVLGEEGAFTHELNPNLFPFIDWNVIIGQAVDQFQPLTNGIDVLDVINDNDWHLSFPGVADIERFNSFGVQVAVEALTADSDVADAIRFALRIKPTYTKMFMRFLLTSGNEDLSEDLDDDAFFALIPNLFEDMSFDEGSPPEDPQQTLRLGEGHKLGQGKKLGGTGLWHPRHAGMYARQGPFIDDGQIVDGSDIFVGTGGFGYAEVDTTADGVVVDGSDIFTTSGAHVFVIGDVGKLVVVLDSPEALDNDAFEIVEFLNGSQVRLDHAFAADAPALDWRLRTPGFQANDLGKNIVVKTATDPADIGEFKISGGFGWGDSAGITNINEVRVLHTFNTTESDLDWELRDYASLGEDFQLGELHAFKTPIEGTNLPSEFVDATQIVNVGMTP
jgi:hypothetical protein